MNVLVTDYFERNNSKGETFFVIQVSGGNEFITSKDTGKVYLSSKKATIPTSFSQQQCEAILGSEFTGQILKEQCEPYSFFDDNGTEHTRDFRYVFVPATEETYEDAVLSAQEVDKI